MAKRRKKKTVIKNYGLMWSRDGVLWGHGGRKGKGTLEGQRKRQIIDFREQIGVYVLYDEGRRPIYVGQAGQGNARLFKRLRSHRADHLADRWRYFSWFGLLVVNKNKRLSKRDTKGKRVAGTIGSLLDEIEGVLIAATEPRFNKQGAKFQGIHQYEQVKHEDEAVSLSELRDSIRELGERIEKLR